MYRAVGKSNRCTAKKRLIHPVTPIHLNIHMCKSSSNRGHLGAASSCLLLLHEEQGMLSSSDANYLE